jgi:hypothetical protein
LLIFGPILKERLHDIEELTCLHKQITEWVLCGHFLRHQDLADAVIHSIGSRDAVTCRLIKAATA